MKGRNLSFEQFQKTNAYRCNSAYKHGVRDWPIENWALAIAGESGELCNLVKKVIRGDFTLVEKRKEILKELADVITYCDLAMSHLDADTGEELTEKFNEVSKRQNCGVIFSDFPAVIEKAHQIVGCKYCEAGELRVPSSVSDGFVHNTSIGRVICSLTQVSA